MLIFSGQCSTVAAVSARGGGGGAAAAAAATATAATAAAAAAAAGEADGEGGQMLGEKGPDVAAASAMVLKKYKCIKINV